MTKIATGHGNGADIFAVELGILAVASYLSGWGEVADLTIAAASVVADVSSAIIDAQKSPQPQP